MNNPMPYTFIQYLFKSSEHEVRGIKPHGNSKKSNVSSYRRILPSTRKMLKASIHDKTKLPKEVLDEVYCDVGDVTKARSVGQLPRGPQDMYNARFSAKKKGQNSAIDAKEDSSLDLNNIWVLLERAKREEELSSDSVFIRECQIHPELLVVLASNRQLQQVEQFCTNPAEFCVFGIDPTFNIFEQNISLTVTTYRNLKLEHKETGKCPVFIGPLLMHQRKEWKSYSKFAHTLVTENPALEGVLACGTDGETALIDGFKRNFRFAIFLRCFIHVKDNLKRELEDRGIAPSQKKLILEEIFGKQEDTVKFYGLVDCMSEEEFDTKLLSLKESWEEIERLYGNAQKKDSFYQWFQRLKVRKI